jgi:hypothetical protein
MSIDRRLITPAAATTTAVTAAAAATVTAAAATAASTAAATAVTAAAAATTVFTGLGFINSQTPSVVLLIVKPLDGRLSLSLGVHLDEPEPFASARCAVLNHLRALHGAELREQLLQSGVTHTVGQISDIQLLAHR